MIINSINKFVCCACFSTFSFLFRLLSALLQDLVDTYGLSNDDFTTEELEEACANIGDTLEADNYEDQLPQPEVNTFVGLHSSLQCTAMILIRH